jgi:hypothetical protein
MLSIEAKSAQGCSSPWLLHQEIENQCWVVLYFYEEPLVPVLKNKLQLCFSFDFTHKWNWESSSESGYSKKHKFWIWFWKSDLVLIHFILTQPRTNGLMQVNLWISLILIFFSFFFGVKSMYLSSGSTHKSNC